MRYYVIEVFDKAKEFSEDEALFILTKRFRGELLSITELGAHRIYQNMRAALVEIGNSGNELDFDSAERAESALKETRVR